MTRLSGGSPLADDAIELALAEHAQIKELLSGIERAAAGSPPDAAALVDGAERFHQALDRHERREEEVLFPALGGMAPVQHAVRDHARMRDLRGELKQALQAARRDASDDACRALKGHVDRVTYALVGHMLNEEQLVFQTARAVLGPDRLRELGARMTALA